MKRAVLLGLLLAAAFSAWALEIKEGRIKLVLHEDIGRFSIYFLKDLRGGEYLPLLLDKDPRTSLLSILVDNKALRMGEAGGFTLQTDRGADGAGFTWRSPSLEIVQRFSFAKTREAALVDGLRMRISVKNLGDRTVKVGVRCLFDTYLGEKSSNHFSTPKQRIGSELVLKPAADEAFWLSSSGEAGETAGFQFMMAGEGQSAPEEVILANWKRLNEAAWRLPVSPGRNFNQLPYSINDSAAAVYYPEEPLAKGESRDLIAFFGNASSGNFVASSGPSGISTILQQAAGTGAAGSAASAKNDLLTLGNLIDKINELLKRDKPVSEDELVLLRQVVEELARRKNQPQNK